jgi:hypothetical protein
MNRFFGPNFMRQNHPNTVSPIAAESIITTLVLDRIALSQTNEKNRSTKKIYYFSDFSFLFSKSRPMHLSQNEFKDYEGTPVCFN